MIRFFYFCLLIILIFSGCADDSSNDYSDYSNAKKMTVSFTWPSDYGLCFELRNPEISVSDIPEDTKYFRVSVIDIQNNNYNHGGGTVYNRGTGKIAYGTLGNYKGPCPSRSPQGYGTYEFTVLAYDSNDGVVGIGSHVEEFP